MNHEPITSHTKNYVHQVWLASLGTVGMLQKEGGKRVETRSKATPAKGRGKGGSLAETVVAKKETYQKKLEAQLQD
jgi:hypothetical protein